MSKRERPVKAARRVNLKRIYTKADIAGLDHVDSVPGHTPYVRGIHASMYTHKPWTIRQYAGYSDAADTNLAFRRALAEGAQGLSVAFDLPTQRGYDSDDARAHADVGMAGVAIDTVDDMSRLFDGIALDEVSVSMTMNGAVLPVLAAFIVAAQERGVDTSQLRGTIQNDILKEYMVRNTYVFAPEPAMRITADVAGYLARQAPHFNALSVSGYHFQEAGAHGVLELALTLANACTYVEALMKRGMSPDLACERMSFFFGVGKDFYLEIAKLRAARLVWAELAQRFGATTKKACALRMHCQTSGWSLAAQQVDNNIVRTTIEALAAVFGGTQSLHTNAYDEAWCLPSVDAARLARDTQLILQHEMGLCDVVDPWAGSYMIESLTSEIAQGVRDKLDEIERNGGVLEAIRSGWIQQEIGESATQTQAEIDSGKRVIVGSNRFVSEHGDKRTAPSTFSVDNRVVRTTQARRIAAIKSSRDTARVTRALETLTDAAKTDANLLDAAIECMRSRATVGECIQALETVWPRYATPISLNAGVYADRRESDAQWGRACARVRELAGELGRQPAIYLAKLGQDGHDRGIRLMASALTDAGFQTTVGEYFATPAETVRSALSAGCDILGVSSLGGAHATLVPDVLAECAKQGLGARVVLGGIIPDDDARVLRQAGVDAVFSPGGSIESIIESLVEIISIGRVAAARHLYAV